MSDLKKMKIFIVGDKDQVNFFENKVKKETEIAL